MSGWPGISKQPLHTPYLYATHYDYIHPLLSFSSSSTKLNIFPSFFPPSVPFFLPSFLPVSLCLLVCLYLSPPSIFLPFQSPYRHCYGFMIAKVMINPKICTLLHSSHASVSKVFPCLIYDILWALHFMTKTYFLVPSTQK